MLMYELIKTKRDGGTLQQADLREIITGYVSGEIPDYQMAAFLMAVFIRGYSTTELGAWTRAMLFSGETIQFEGSGPYLDKHSTGGVGDKVSLPLAPLVAALGVRDPMISGRGLGHTGGTLDKLESIPGFQTRLPVSRFKHIVDTVGCAIIGQTDTLVPADKKIYSLRDVTATVDSIPLISSSILSKKAASGISGLIMDVKVGTGAFMRTPDKARVLAQTLVSLGGELGLNVRAFLTEMSQPLGVKCGNALEVEESIDVLKGTGPADTTELVILFATHTLLLAGLEKDEAVARRNVEACLASGKPLHVFARMIEAQGGDPHVCDTPSLLPQATHRIDWKPSGTGFVVDMDSEALGMAIVALGGGRKKIDDIVDPAVGALVHARIGDKLDGNPACTLCYNDDASLAEALPLFEKAYILGEKPVARPSLVKEQVG